MKRGPAAAAHHYALNRTGWQEADGSAPERSTSAIVVLGDPIYRGPHRLGDSGSTL